MEAKRLPNGNILIPISADDPKRWMYGERMEITPSHIKFAYWDDYLKKNTNDKNPNPPRLERKKRGEPRLSLKYSWEQDWLFVVTYYYPELYEPERFIHEIKKRLESICELSPKEKKYLIEHLNTAPDPPKTNRVKNFIDLDWMAWLAYYVLCQKAGKFISPEIISKMTRKSVETVKSQFKTAERRIDTWDFTGWRKEIESKMAED